MKLNEAIKHLRKRNGLTQIEFAKLIGITQTAISQIESDNPKKVKRPHESTLKKMAKVLNVSVATIYACSFELHELEEIMTVLNSKHRFEIKVSAK